MNGDHPNWSGTAEEYYEFYADEEKLDKLVLELFYAPK